MMITHANADYIARVIRAIDEGKIEGSMLCDECDEMIDPTYGGEHVIYQTGWGSQGKIPMGAPTIIICCMGYHCLADQLG